jgi:hypothetical protein
MSLVSHLGGYVNTHNITPSKTVLNHLNVNSLTTGTTYIKVVDLSDIFNYKHENTTEVSLEWLELQTDVSGLSEYEICLGFLKNVTDVSGDFVCIKSWHEEKTVGSSILENINFNHPGVTCSESNINSVDITSSVSDLSDTSTCISTLFPAGGDTSGFGNGDLVLKVNITTGTVDLSFECIYYTE